MLFDLGFWLFSLDIPNLCLFWGSVFMWIDRHICQPCALFLPSNQTDINWFLTASSLEEFLFSEAGCVALFISCFPPYFFHFYHSFFIHTPACLLLIFFQGVQPCSLPSFHSMLAPLLLVCSDIVRFQELGHNKTGNKSSWSNGEHVNEKCSCPL